MPAPDTLSVFAGDCLVHTDDGTHRGKVVVLLKPDNTVLVHDVDGYQPVAWLTRVDSVARTRNGGFSVTAIAGRKTLRVESQSAYGFGEYPGSKSGIPIGTCPDCERALVPAGPSPVSAVRTATGCPTARASSTNSVTVACRECPSRAATDSNSASPGSASRSTTR